MNHSLKQLSDALTVTGVPHVVKEQFVEDLDVIMATRDPLEASEMLLLVNHPLFERMVISHRRLAMFAYKHFK